jgi:hypothetical protein
VRVVVSPHNVVNYPEGGGHLWVYLQYVQGLRSIGCDVWWLEEFKPSPDSGQDAARIAAFRDRLEPYGLRDRFILYTAGGEFLNVSRRRVRAICRETDLLLNFYQRIPRWVLEQFRRTALVDIDPGLLQYWISSGEMLVQRHDLYFTTGETVGKPRAHFPDCGLRWIPIRPPVSLDLWPRTPAPPEAPFTTVSGWWGRSDWIRDGDEVYDNNKRHAFLEYAELPRRTQVPLELALDLNLNSPDDEADLQLLASKGWRIRLSPKVAGTPERYQHYIQSSRGEFSCAKQSCMRFQNAWVSDRTLCYLASGRPAVVQDTGPSSILPNGRGFFRFSTLEEAAAALDEIASAYKRHALAARELAELFDARRVAETIVRECR